MRLHTDHLTTSSLFNLMDAVKKDGDMATHVHFDKLDEHGSRSRARAFEIHLGSDIKIKGDGRRWTNSGSRGAGGTYAATYDEWGWLIAAIFEADPNATFGQYKGRDDFHNQTHGAYSY